MSSEKFASSNTANPAAVVPPFDVTFSLNTEGGSSLSLSNVAAPVSYTHLRAHET